MKLDGYDLLVGDKVFDLVFGPGRVDRITEGENRFWVVIGNRNECYDNKGNGRFGVRTLYWRDPIIVPPCKNDRTWEQIIEIAVAVNKIIGVRE